MIDYFHPKIKISFKNEIQSPKKCAKSKNLTKIENAMVYLSKKKIKEKRKIIKFIGFLKGILSFFFLL